MLINRLIILWLYKYAIINDRIIIFSKDFNNAVIAIPNKIVCKYDYHDHTSRK